MLRGGGWWGDWVDVAQFAHECKIPTTRTPYLLSAPTATSDQCPDPTARIQGGGRHPQLPVWHSTALYRPRAAATSAQFADPTARNQGGGLHQRQRHLAPRLREDCHTLDHLPRPTLRMGAGTCGELWCPVQLARSKPAMLLAGCMCCTAAARGMSHARSTASHSPPCGWGGNVL